RSSAVDIIVIDSVAALVPKAELDGEIGDTHMGLQARMMSQAMRKLTGAIAKSRTTVVFINQIREKIGVMFGSPETTPGGRALKFYSSCRIDVRRVSTLKEGENTIEALVAPSWYSGEFGLSWSERPGRGYYGDHVAVLAQLEVDGEVVVATDTSWTATSTAFTEAEIYHGEMFDARVTHDDAQPAEVTTIDFDRSVLVAPPVPPVRRTEVLLPKERKRIDDNTCQIDFGQNLVGWMKLALRDAEPGAEVVMRHAEILGNDGRLCTEPLRTARATDTYIARGVVTEEYEPTFTFHGFRYAEISGIDPDKVDVEAIVVHSDLERIGSFECSDDLINKLHSNVVWGQRGNFVSVPTDCPQRDERLGWTGDAQVFSPTASFLFDCETFWENWLADLAADQREDGCVQPIIPDMGLPIGNGTCGWSDASVVIPMTTYEAYGDPTVLRMQLRSMTAWADYLFGRLDDEHRWSKDFQFGDWLDPDAPRSEPWKAKARFDLVATAYAVRTNDLVARAATILGEPELAERYVERASLIRESWQRHYAEAALTTQTGCGLAIEFDLVGDEEKKRYGDALVQLIRDAGNHLATGFLGTPLLLPALEHTGHLDVAYDVFTQTTCPSWLYPVLAGATTIWERWDALLEDGSVATEALGVSGSSMVSFNHYAYGAVAEWLHASLAGLALDKDEPGYR
ncbi:MAG: family 78 glycoside hydrolase catalytic domain, partial [Actinomycetota bacterium]